MVMGLLCAALLVASTLLWAMAAPPRLWGVSVFGVAGYVVAVYLSYRLLRAIHRSGDLSA